MPQLFPAALLLLAAASSAEKAPEKAFPNPLVRLAPIAPFAPLAEFARTNRISLEKIGPARDGTAFDPGDSITALVTLVQKSKPESQWLLHLQASDTSTARRAARSKPKPMIMYSSLGTRLEFESVPAPGTVRIAGPFKDPGAKTKPSTPHDVKGQVRFDKGFLSLGLDQAAAAAKRLGKAGLKGAYSFKDSPYEASEIERTRKLMSAHPLAEAEEHAICGSVPAMLSYLDVAQHTEGLKDILLKMIELPSVWSMVRHGGIGTVNMRFIGEGVTPAKPEDWGLPAVSQVFLLPMSLELNKQPALRLTFVVTAPHPPLLGAAGIVGLLAEKPTDPESYLTLRVVSARSSGGAQ